MASRPQDIHRVFTPHGLNIDQEHLAFGHVDMNDMHIVDAEGAELATPTEPQAVLPEPPPKEISKRDWGLRRVEPEVPAAPTGWLLRGISAP